MIRFVRRNALVVLLVVALLMVASLVLAATVGYPQERCDSETSPANCYYVLHEVSPPKSGPIVVAGSDIVVFSSRKILRDVNFCLYFKNNGGGGGSALTDIDIRVSPDNQPGNWHPLTFDECDTLASGQMCTYCMDGNAYGWVMVMMDATNTTATVWYTANRG